MQSSVRGYKGKNNYVRLITCGRKGVDANEYFLIQTSFVHPSSFLYRKFT